MFGFYDGTKFLNKFTLHQGVMAGWTPVIK